MEYCDPLPEISGTPIMGTSKVTVAQMVNMFNDHDKPYPNIYTSKGAVTINDFCKILMQEADAEGVRTEIVFAQAMHETG